MKRLKPIPRNTMLKGTAIAAVIGILGLGSTVIADTDPYTAKYDNNSAISLTGTVIESYEDAFALSYGDGNIVVEMDDWDWYDESQSIREGEKVTVYGEVDHDMYEARKIEAEAVYAHSRNMYYFADDEDEEDRYHQSYMMPTKVDLATIGDDTRVSVSGTVEKIAAREFMMDVGPYMVVVDTEDLGYNPLDDNGFQRLRVGDQVHVSGLLDTGFFDDREIDADLVLTLQKSARADAS